MHIQPYSIMCLYKDLSFTVNMFFFLLTFFNKKEKRKKEKRKKELLHLPNSTCSLCWILCPLYAHAALDP